MLELSIITQPLTRTSFGIWLVFVIFGCDPAPRTFTPNDLSLPVAGQDQIIVGGISPDMYEETDLNCCQLDSGLEDQQMEGGTEADAYLPPVTPLPTERAVLHWRGKVYVIWRSGTTLWRSKVDTVDLLRDGEDLSLHRGEPWFDLEEIDQELNLDFQVRGHLDPLLFISAANTESFALRLDLDNPEMISLGLTQPLLTAEGDGALFIIGSNWMPPNSEMEDPTLEEEVSSNEDSGMGWRFYRGGEWSKIKVDEHDLKSLVSSDQGLGGWVIGDKMGQCFLIAEREGLVGSWRCESRPDSLIFGLENSLTHWGEINRQTITSEQTINGIWLWSGTPGRSSSPLDATPSVYEEDGPRQLPLNHVQYVMDGTLSRWLSTSAHPALLLTNSFNQTIILSPSGSSVLPEQMSSEDVVGVLQIGDQIILVTWDENEGMPSFLDLSMTWSPLIQQSTFPEDEQCLVEIERCDDLDHDCDGQTHNQLCCPNGELNVVGLNDVFFPDLNWKTAESEIGVLISVASQGQARLFSFSTEGGDSTLRATWDGIETVENMGNYFSLVALSALNEEGSHELLLNQRDPTDSSTFLRIPAPCVPLGIRVLDESHAIRVFCEEHAVLIEAEGSQEVEPYPESGRLMWMTSWLPSQGAANESYFLVALGDGYQLSLWRDEGRGGVSYGETEMLFLPSSLGDLTVEDRLLPIQLPPNNQDLLSRLLDNKRVEVWFPLLGWTPLGGQRWPYWATLSQSTPAAITAGYSEDPDVVGDSFLQRLEVRVHPLSERGTLLGEVIKSRVSRDSFGGSHFGNYDDLQGVRPNFLSLVGGSLEMQQVTCH